MNRYRIGTRYGTTYVVDEDGCFLQYNDNKWDHPHDTWKCTGVAEMTPFGQYRLHSLEDFIQMIESGKVTTFKNGSPKFTLTDLDHGTHRIHGNVKAHGIQYAYKLQQKEE